MSTPPESFAQLTPADLNALGAGWLPGLLGVEVLDIGGRRVVSRLEIRPHHSAPNGYLHAATVVALADTSCGYGCLANLPSGATGFTTIELKSNFISTVTEGALHCEAELVHGGRSTQLWDAKVSSDRDRRLSCLVPLHPATPASRLEPASMARRILE